MNEYLCNKCNHTYDIDDMVRSKNPFAVNGHMGICLSCAQSILEESNWAWDTVDKFCQYMDIPFIPAQFETARSINQDTVLRTYTNMFFHEDYVSLTWKKYHDIYLELERMDQLDDELPLLSKERTEELKRKWGGGYTADDVRRLEHLYISMMESHNINMASEIDMLMKYCMMSHLVDEKIRNREDVTKDISAYNSLIKSAGFERRESTDNSNFTSIGELVLYLEKKGTVFKYYDNVSRDVVDETLQNIQKHSRDLYTGESGLGDEITRRLEAIRVSDDIGEVDTYALDQDYDIDTFELESAKFLSGLDGDEFVEDFEDFAKAAEKDLFDE